ncbi:MAG TPA: helix-turn-helix transcriptional regulator [Bacteroidota bacterium]|nr:helix-turn-helix transcriptional regulator [Bacteroidota bacterium]
MNDPGYDVAAAVHGMRTKMAQWGISHTFLARCLGVSRQYVWQVFNAPSSLSAERAQAIEEALDLIIDRQMHLRTLGDRLRAARRSAGMTLKEVAKTIGYSWVVIERWETNVALPSLQVLLRLCGVYGVSFEIVGADQRHGRQTHHRPRNTYLVPVEFQDELPGARPSQRRPRQAMVIRISAGDLAGVVGKGSARGAERSPAPLNA